MGIVYLAEDTTLMRRVALKVLDQAVTSNPQFAQRFQQEARLVASLNHPNIVAIHALSQLEDEWVIEMPYIEGGSLMDAEERGSLNLRAIVRCIRDILLALASCHESDIIHRDVKPSNILLGENGRGLLSDFGLAKLLSLHQRETVSASCSASLFIGTPRYAPPESWEAQEPTRAWDIYSAGMVLYEAVAGRTPYDAQTPLSLMKQMLERPIPPLQEMAPHVSEELSNLVDAMLARDPADRPQDVADVLEAFWALPELSEDSLSPPVRVKPRSGKRTKPRKPGIRHPDHRPKLRFLARMSGVLLLVLTGIGAGVAGFQYILNQPLQGPFGNTDNAFGHIVFDMINLETQERLSGACIGKATAENRSWVMVAAGADFLWHFELIDEPDGRVTISGHWADYDRETAMVFRHGALSGDGRWTRQNEDLSLRLTLENSENTSVPDKLLLLQGNPSPAAGSELLCSLLGNNAAASLVYNELPARNLSWGDSLHSFFSDLGLAQLHVAPKSVATPSFLLDGRLIEPVWRAALDEDTHRTSQVSPADGPKGSFLRAWRDDDALYLGLHVTSVIEAPRLFAALQTMHAVPAANAVRRMIQADGNHIVAAQQLPMGTQTSWDCDWEVRQQATQDALEIEIKVPLANLVNGSTSLAGQTWLLNLEVGHALSNNARSSVAFWGSPVLENTPCGLTLLFEP